MDAKDVVMIVISAVSAIAAVVSCINAILAKKKSSEILTQINQNKSYTDNSIDFGNSEFKGNTFAKKIGRIDNNVK